MKTYTITLDETTKELVLNALMEKAYSCDGQAKDNYLRAYGDIKESIMNQ